MRDFVVPAAPVVDITLPDPGPAGSYNDVLIWGDWVAATKRSGEWWSWVAMVTNYRTDMTLTAPANSSLLALGDGFAIINDYDSDRIAVWNLATDTMAPLVATEDHTPGPVATDGAGVAFVKGTSLVIKTIAGAGRSAPRVLGVVAPRTLKGTWKAAIDLTKAVRSGRLEIRNAAGHSVRSITVKSTKDGSLRGIAWNGRDNKGKRVAEGSYTYRLTNRSADGSGAILLVDGSVGPLGTIRVP